MARHSCDLPSFRPFRLIKPNFSDPQVRKGIRTWLPEADLDDPAVQTAILDFSIPTQIINQALATGHTAYKAAPAVACPTLVIQGNEDTLVRSDTTRQLAARLSGPTTFETITAEHDLTRTEQPAWPHVRRLIQDFATTIERDAVVK